MSAEISERAAIAALVVAAGRGLRAGGSLPKQYRRLGGHSVLRRALATLLDRPEIGQVLVMIGAGDEARYREALGDLADLRLLAPIVGGETRQETVRLGLEALAGAGFDGTVLIHDAARPFASAALVERACSALGTQAGAVPVVAVSDTIKRVDAGGRVVETPPREQLRSVQTPQVFRFASLLAAHRSAHAQDRGGFTDDAGLIEWAGHDVGTFPGDIANLKLTYPEDFTETAPLRVRVATGYDVHAFTEGDHVWLGGVRIEHDSGVAAHSDGDVALHALTDALLGALSDGDIGTHFPPSDPQWRGASSDRFLAFAAGRLRERGGVIDFLDLTIVCEAPRIGPHRDAMRARIAEIAGIGRSQVAIKATTSERMGFTGRREGLAALATATIRLPQED